MSRPAAETEQKGTCRESGRSLCFEYRDQNSSSSSVSYTGM